MGSHALETRLKQLGTLLGRARDDVRKRPIVPRAPEAVMGLTFEPGRRVVDRVTGREGVIARGTKANVVVGTPRR